MPLLSFSPFRGLVLALLLAACLAPATALADSAVLTVREGDETRELTLETIESVGTHEVEMRHPEGPEGRFSGVWLDDLLAAQGLDEAPRVRFTATDHYTAFLTPAQRDKKDYLLVTRLDGEPLAADVLGPLMLVVPADEQAVLDGTQPMTRWIWSIEEIGAR
jgi:hypothetical protein